MFWIILALVIFTWAFFNSLIKGIKFLFRGEKDAWVRFLIVLGVCFYLLGIPTNISLLLALVVSGMD